jgi:hypothetical protein
LKEKTGEGWSKEYREMDDDKLLVRIKEYMQSWMMLEETEEAYILNASCGLQRGSYHRDFT